MFDFEKLNVYQSSKEFCKICLVLINYNKNIDSYIKDQLKRSSISIVLNIAEGSGRFSKADKRNFY
ncbi:MAG: four helix bundle protein, partial [Candidatus Absconditabacteria bacterium]